MIDFAKMFNTQQPKLLKTRQVFGAYMGTQHSRKPGPKLVYLVVCGSLSHSSRGEKGMLRETNVVAKPRKLEGEGARHKKGGMGAPEIVF